MRYKILFKSKFTNYNNDNNNTFINTSLLCNHSRTYRIPYSRFIFCVTINYPAGLILLYNNNRRIVKVFCLKLYAFNRTTEILSRKR